MAKIFGADETLGWDSFMRKEPEELDATTVEKLRQLLAELKKQYPKTFGENTSLMYKRPEESLTKTSFGYPYIAFEFDTQWMPKTPFLDGVLDNGSFIRVMKERYNAKKADILAPFRGKSVYLACPYSNEFRHRERWNVEAATFIATYMIANKIMVNSPITHGDAVYEASLRNGMDVPKDFEFWKNMCLWGVDSADVVGVIQLDGWRGSKGVTAELAHAEEVGKPIVRIYPESVPGFIKHMAKWDNEFNSNF